ncbi:FKBP-type peptidyl-prolyl cis-trans isomerase [Arachidicoccus sp.]|uniref:FKBP-type peptidyl-prolyl cis-trans isomerase n=1 Tax=Arachidicoccus sp. TaxID=1872624 RepID=UPI003D1CCFF8
MKKTRLFISVSLFALLLIGVSSCVKNNAAPASQAQNPALEKPQIDSFIAAKGYMMQEDPAATGLMYQIVNWGDTTHRVNNDSTFAVVKYKGTLMNGAIFDSTAADTTRTFDMTQPLAVQAFSYYVLKIGVGGMVRFVTPSIYAYGPQAINDTNGNTIIPANSPLYFEIQLVNVSNNSAVTN